MTETKYRNVKIKLSDRQLEMINEIREYYQEVDPDGFGKERLPNSSILSMILIHKYFDVQNRKAKRLQK